ncbi:MAG TPA: biotin/lipoyl-binding protein [Planctomycetota bacterium]|nr:biotin/lipoyl-binding protein [Planctomycetota bacterium]
MITRYVLPLLALLGVAFALIASLSADRSPPVAQAVADPARPPFPSYVAGAGIVEASTENIALGTPVAGLVTAVKVVVGDRVKAGDVLFELDDRALQAELLVARAALEQARSALARLKSLPRPEDVPPAQARLAAARSELADAQNTLSLWESVTDKRAVTRETLDQRRFSAQSAQARVAEQEGALALLAAGAWGPDLAAAQADVDAAQARVHQAETEVDRLKVRAPVAGQLLQVKVRAGEFAPAGVLATPLMLLGNVDRLHVRVDVDENDAWRVRPGARAVASARGNKDIAVELGFVRTEPFVVPKVSLTGESVERVDTRVLQVLYSFERGDRPLYVGQQMDVFIDAPPLHPTDVTSDHPASAGAQAPAVTNAAAAPAGQK